MILCIRLFLLSIFFISTKTQAQDVIAALGRDFLFSPSSKLSFVELVLPKGQSFPEATEITFCAFVNPEKQSNKYFYSVLSYGSSPQDENLILMFSELTDVKIRNTLGSYLDAPKYGEWTHLCFTWSSKTGSIDLLINNKKIQLYGATNRAVEKGKFIAGGGKFLLGQAEAFGNSNVKQYQPEWNFQGRMSLVNCWDRVLTAAEVQKASKGKLFGNIVNWKNATWKLTGDVSVKSTKVPFMRKPARG